MRGQRASRFLCQPTNWRDNQPIFSVQLTLERINKNQFEKIFEFGIYLAIFLVISKYQSKPWTRVITSNNHHNSHHWMDENAMKTVSEFSKLF